MVKGLFLYFSFLRLLRSSVESNSQTKILLRRECFLKNIKIKECLLNCIHSKQKEEALNIWLLVLRKTLLVDEFARPNRESTLWHTAIIFQLNVKNFPRCSMLLFVPSATANKEINWKLMNFPSLDSYILINYRCTLTGQIEKEILSFYCFVLESSCN